MSTQGLNSVILLKMVQRCGILQINHMTSPDQGQLSQNSVFGDAQKKVGHGF